MTVWAGDRIAGFAYEAGFRGDNLTLAVAVALAASDGDDRAHVHIAAAGDSDWRGLWLVRTSLLTADELGRVFDPRGAARAVWRLVGGNGGDWRWSEVWQADTWRARLPEAVAAVTGAGDQGARMGPGPVADTAPMDGIRRQVLAAIVNTANGVHRMIGTKFN